MPHLDPEDIASEIEEYVGAIEALSCALDLDAMSAQKRRRCLPRSGNFGVPKRCGSALGLLALPAKICADNNTQGAHRYWLDRTAGSQRSGRRPSSMSTSRIVPTSPTILSM